MSRSITAPAAAAIADASGWETSQTRTRSARAETGQFFTPLPVARMLAGWFRRSSLNQSRIHLLDPGAGCGVLTAAVVDRVAALRAEKKLPRLREMTLEVWEQDVDFLPELKKTLDICAGNLSREGVCAVVRLNHGNYVDGATQALDPGLFGETDSSLVTHAILNPPYRKLHSNSLDRARLSSVGIETSNLYAAFVWLAFRQLATNGELSAITPRSFCNGPYFREFRGELLDEGTFSRLHVFDSRAEAFGRDQVLQENILFHLRRCRQNHPSAVTISTGSIEAPTTRLIPGDQFVSPNDSERVLHIAPEDDAREIRAFFDSLPCKLPELGVEVSTGPVVDFRLKDHLSPQLTSECVPLIYPHCVRSGKILPPLETSEAYHNARVRKKPVAIQSTETTRKWLLPVEMFVLIKRFSSKEEKRRLVSGVLNPENFQPGLVGIENHLNFFHRKRSGLPKSLARGLSRFLNSTVADRYFRQFNGHTQVNATDLRMLRYPDLPTLSCIGKLSIDDTDQAAIDRAMVKILDAPDIKA